VTESDPIAQSPATLSSGAPPAAATTDTDDGFAADFGGEPDSRPARKPSAPSGNGQPASQKSFDPAKVDWYRAKPDELPAEWRPYQQHLKAQQAEQTRASQRAADLERQMAQMRQQLDAQAQTGRIAETLEKLQPKDDPYADLKARLDPEEHGAIDVVREILKRELGSAIPSLDPITQRLQLVEQYVVQLAQRAQQQAMAGQVSDLQAAVQKHGQAALEGVAPTIAALVRSPNPKTGRPFTVQEAADLLLGAPPASNVAAARETDQAVRAAAKRSVSGGPNGSPVSGQSSGPLSDSELLGALAELGFSK